MKIYNKLIALVVACGLVGVSYAQDEAAGGNLTDNISIAGFVDASYSTGEETGAADTESLGIDEVEIDFLFGQLTSLNNHIYPADYPDLAGHRIVPQRRIWQA